jgi:hypothetical protein
MAAARRKRVLIFDEGGRGSAFDLEEVPMIGVAVALSLAATCPATDARAELLALHEDVRQGHLRGDPAAIAAGTGDQLLLAENGGIRLQSKAEVAQFFDGYLKRVRYLEWRDLKPPVVEISPDGQMAWMAVAVEAKYTRADRPAEGEKRFKSSWVATYKRENCEWRMTAIASDIVE